MMLFAAVGAMGFVLFEGMDFLLSLLLLPQLTVLTPLHPRGWGTRFRIKHPVFHHTLLPMYDGKGVWGSRIYPVRTNSLGFVDAHPRRVEKESAKPRIVFMGDSFTEGLGLPWEQTFVGLVSQSMPNSEVLNAAVVSYSPTTYYRKLKWLIDEGYAFDHAVVMVDLSDVHDETLYIERDGVVSHRADVPKVEPRRLRSFIQEHFWLTSFSLRTILTGGTLNAPARGRDVFNIPRGAWTYKREDPATRKAYEPMGIDEAINKSKQWMDRTFALLQKRGIKLTVGVYPWPAQLFHQDRESAQRRIWESWCAGKCENFIDAFPEFFEQKDRLGPGWYEALFIPDDVHFSQEGNRIVAEKIIRVLGGTPHRIPANP
jgi:lysophospholipase L1-like esterase